MEMENGRYERNFLVENFSAEKQQLLKESSVCVVGAGGLGGYVLQSLAAIGIGTIKIIEFDVVSLSNLNRQILYKHSDIGKSKGESAQKLLSQLNNQIDIIWESRMLTMDNSLELFEGFDVVVDCTDNFSARHTIDYRCSELKIPMVHASVEGMKASITTFTYKNDRRYSDLYGQMPSDDKSTPPGVLSPIVSLAGSIEAAEVVKLITRLGEPLEGELLTIDLFNNKFTKYCY